MKKNVDEDKDNRLESIAIGYQAIASRGDFKFISFQGQMNKLLKIK
jgi:hypothetical protein